MSGSERVRGQPTDVVADSLDHGISLG